jgi:hypothetical protein
VRWNSGSPLFTSNSFVGTPKLNVVDSRIGTVIREPLPSRSNSSRPFGDHSGARPPLLDTSQSPPFTFGNGRT